MRILNSGSIAGRMGTEKDDMRNICELPISVVSDYEPKMLTGSYQKVRG